VTQAKLFRPVRQSTRLEIASLLTLESTTTRPSRRASTKAPDRRWWALIVASSRWRGTILPSRLALPSPQLLPAHHVRDLTLLILQHPLRPTILNRSLSLRNPTCLGAINHLPCPCHGRDTIPTPKLIPRRRSARCCSPHSHLRRRRGTRIPNHT
jgi:hypothetical protein